MAPTTPRAGSTATPRSARRLTSALLGGGTPSRVTVAQPLDLPALPPLNPKKYPATPYADDPRFADMLQQDMENVDSAVEILSHATDEMRRQLREHLTHLESERVSYDHRIRELGELARENVKTQAKERHEMDNAKRNEEEVHRQQQKLKVKLEGYQQEVREALAKLQARRELKARQLSAFNAQLALNKPELDHFERYLGLKMRGKGNDIVQFKFVHLDRTSYSRTFSFDLDVSSASYSLPSVSPTNYLPPSVTQNLVRNLNEKRITLYAFIREMRFAFCVEIEVEKRLGPNSGGGAIASPSEEAREREREQIRSEAEGDLRG
ncbi:hypothetical protein JCM11491_006764 [Sporobolomyces phaffii]